MTAFTLRSQHEIVAISHELTDYAAMLSTNLRESIDAKFAAMKDSTLLAVFSKAVHEVVKSYLAGGRLFIAGNGGSAADSQHLAAEFISKLSRDRNPLPAEALTTDSSILTAIGNDYGFEHVFSRQLIAKARPEDMFLGITTSGESKNILQALEVCRQRGVKTIVLAGRDGGAAAKIADFALIVPGTLTSTIQELHIVFAHTLCEAVERVVAPAH